MEYSNHNQQEKGKRSAERWPFFLIGISLVVLVIAGFHLLQYYGSYREETVLNDRLQQIRSDIENGSTVISSETDGTADQTANGSDNAMNQGSTPEPELSPEEKSRRLKDAMVAINPEYIGWLELKDTTISYPVVFRDNEYYINHDFEGKSNSHGAIFLDETCNEESLIWLIHGHHMKDGTMFAGLAEYKNKDYLEEHTTLSFDAGEGVENYRIYAAALIDFSNETELVPAFHYEKLPETPEEFKQWQNNLKRNSYWYDGALAAAVGASVEVPLEASTDALSAISRESLLPEVLVLSTCEYGTELQRLIVVAVKEKQ